MSARHLASAVPGAAGALILLLWWFWPQLAPRLAGSCPADRRVLVVLADDPRRTELAFDLWQREPSSSLWVLGGSPLQQATLRQLARRGLAPSPDRYHMFQEGSDTVGQLTALSRVLPSSVCAALLITDAAHNARALAVARQALGDRGLQVDAPPRALLPPVLPLESPGRLLRDVLRVQLWRLSGWDGRSLGLWLRGARP